MQFDHGVGSNRATGYHFVSLWWLY